jgi:hypothetical protein
VSELATDPATDGTAVVGAVLVAGAGVHRDLLVNAFLNTVFRFMLLE